MESVKRKIKYGKVSNSNDKDASCGVRTLEFVKQKVPILEWLPNYNRMTAVSDLIAGVTLGLTLVPQSIAYAALANLPAQYGLYSSFIGTILYAVFGTIKEVSIGPTSLMALLTLQYCRGFAIEYIILLTFLSGCVVMLMGLLRLGFLVDLISAPVTSGFTSATAIIIMVSQIKGILGIRFKAESPIDNFIKISKSVHQIQWQDIVLGLSCCVFLLILRKIKDVPVKQPVVKNILWMFSIGRNALVVLVTASVSMYIETKQPVPFLLSNHVKTGVPPFSLPKFSLVQGNQTISLLDMCHSLGSSLIVVPVVMVLANIAIAKAFSAGRRVDATQEMLTLGLCNLLGACFQAMPTTGAFTRSAVSHASGVKTPFAGLYSGAITLLALSFLTPYFYYIPRATLSAILMCAVIFMVDYQIVGVLWRGKKLDLMVLLITFLGSLLISVESGLLIGIMVNILYLLFLWYRPQVEVVRLKSSSGGEYVRVMPNMGLLYLTIDFLKVKVENAAAYQGENLLPVLIDCSRLQSIDYTACKGLELLSKSFEKTNQKLIYFNASSQIIDKLETMTSIDPRYFHCTNEADMLDALFTLKDENTTTVKMECFPLLAETFRKKDSIASEASVKCDIETVLINSKDKVMKGSKSIELIAEENVEDKVEEDSGSLEKLDENQNEK